jgi:tetratricopeptide (TPR) repeat protein
LSLFSRTWNHSATREPFARLCREAELAGEPLLAELLAARMAAFDCRADRALAMVDAILERHPRNLLAELLKARILCLDRRAPGAALKVYRRLAAAAGGRAYHDKWIGALIASGRAGAHFKLKRFSRAVEGYAAVIEPLAKARKPELRLQLHRARLNKALGHLHLGDHPAALAETEALIEQGARDPGPAFDALVARAMVLRGLIRGADEYHTEALAAFDEVIRRYGGAKTPEVKEVVLTAWVNRGIALRKLRYLDDSLKAFDEVVDRCGAEEMVEIQEAAAMALLHRAEADMDRRDLPYWGRKSAPPHKEN